MEQLKGRFSVILPYYNGSRYIRETVASVLGQTYKDLELLLIDDGSTIVKDSDFLLNLIESEKDERIKYYRKNNGGLSDARNFGVEKCTGEFIAFIDQDDLWDNDKLRLQAEVFASSPGTKFICTDAGIIGEQNGEMRIGEKWGFKDGIIPDTFGKLIKGNFVACSSIAFRRTAIHEVGYSSKAYAVVPDYEYFLRFSEKMDFYFISQSLLSYRLHEGNTTKQSLKGACEVISVLFDIKPRTIANRIYLTINFLKGVALLLCLWLKKIFEKSPRHTRLRIE
jgi:glycosyltransferase involved in cell wall biosynthesis